MRYKTKKITRRKIVNDKIAKVVFAMTKDEQNIFKENGAVGLSVVEKVKRGKAVYDVESDVIVALMDEYTGHKKLTQFDKAVFCACISAQIDGNAAISINQIYRYLGGDDSHKPPKENEKAIEDSLKRLMMCLINVDCTQLAHKSKYNFGKVTKFYEVILPGRYEESVLNGQTAKTFIFHKKSPLFEIAEIKKQILTVPLKVMQVDGLQNTPRAIAIKEYITQRVVEYQKAKDRRKLSDSILFSEIYHAAELDSDATNKQKYDVREIAEKVLDNLVDNHVLDSYVALLQNRTYHSIKFVVVEGDKGAKNSIGDLVAIGS